jgi:hypothetical protein
LAQIVTELQTKRTEVEKELRGLDGAIAALKGVAGGSQARPGRGGRRILSAAARKSISDAQKARWAKFKKTQRKAS